jgi:hypothetical protein
MTGNAGSLRHVAGILSRALTVVNSIISQKQFLGFGLKPGVKIRAFYPITIQEAFFPISLFKM